MNIPVTKRPFDSDTAGTGNIWETSNDCPLALFMSVSGASKPKAKNLAAEERFGLLSVMPPGQLGVACTAVLGGRICPCSKPRRQTSTFRHDARRGRVRVC